MSTLQVANLHFESTGNNRIQYLGANEVHIIAGNTITAISNSTAFVANTDMFIRGNVLVTNSTANTLFIGSNGNIGIGTNSTPITKMQIDGNYGLKTNSLTAGNNHNVNCALGNFFVITCNSSAQNVYFTNAPTDTYYTLTLRFANGNGGNSISWANTPKWQYGTAPTPSTNNDIWTFFTEDGGTTWRGNLTQRDSR